MLEMNLLIQGGQAILMKYSKLPDKLDKTMEEMSLKVEREAKRLCPVRTGRLRASIHTGKMGQSVYYIGTPVFYAPFVELGTRRMTARPYLRPAAHKVVREYKVKGLFK